MTLLKFQNCNCLKIIPRFTKLLPVLVLGFCGLVVEANAFEKIAVGERFIVACESAAIHNSPSAFSKGAGNVNFGDQISVTELAEGFELPDSDYSSEYVLSENYFKEVEPEEYTRYAWVGIGDGRFISNSCLVRGENFKNETFEKAEEKVKKIASGKGKKGFSQEEDGDLKAMKGAAGAAKGGRANFPKIDELIEQSQGATGRAELKLFRENGKLGEFK